MALGEVKLASVLGQVSGYHWKDSIAAGQFQPYGFSDVLSNNNKAQAGCREASQASGFCSTSGESSDSQCHPCTESRVLIPTELATETLGRNDWQGGGWCRVTSE